MTTRHRRPYVVIAFWMVFGVFAAAVAVKNAGSFWWPEAVAVAIAVTAVGSFLTLRDRS